MRACRALVAISLLLGGGPAPAAAAGPGLLPEALPVLEPAFRASMPDRFGLDADRDGLLDLPNTSAYARNGAGPAGPALFSLHLDASESRASLAGAALPIVEYRWRISGPDGRPLLRRGPMPAVDFRLPEGSYTVALDVRADLGWGTATARVTRDVTVEDFLVVAIGDSYASGDGNPERPRRPGGVNAAWADSPLAAAAEAAHAAAHRSTVAWPALAALALERADPATSVTFVSLAATGARIARGLLGAGSEAQTGQLEQVAALVGDRRIDALLISIGGNDVGFAQVVRRLVDADPQADPVCYRVDLENVWQSTADGDWNRGSGLQFALPWGVGCRPTQDGGRPRLPGLQGLAGELDSLAWAVAAGLDVSAVYLMEYPDPTGGPDGRLCPEIAGDLTPPFGFHEIDGGEQNAARALVLQPLNRLLAEAAARHGWIYVDGVAAAFAEGHGYCADPPSYGPGVAAGAAPFAGAPAGLHPEAWYRHPAGFGPEGPPEGTGVSWYRTAAQSAVLQGPAARWDTTGTLHPNELGHLAMAAAVLRAMGVPGG